MKKLAERYNAPTPMWALKMENVLFLMGNFLTGDALLAAKPLLGTLGMVLTLGSKLMKLFIDDDYIP